MSVRAAIRRMLVFRRPHTDDPLWLRVAVFPLLGPLLRRVSRLWVWILLTTAFALGLGFLPLFGVVGYELAVASALLAAIMGVDVGARLARELQTMPVRGLERSGWPGRMLARGAASAALLATAVMLIPLAVSAVRGLWQPTCDWGFGLQAYLELPIATAALAGAAGHLVGVIAGPRRVVAPLLAQLVLVAIAAAALWRFYAAPAVFTYNAILGYFPGNMYDEHLKLTAALAWSRLEQLLWVIAATGAVAALLDVPSYRVRRRVQPAGPRRPAVALAVLAAGGAVALRGHAGELGYAIDADDIAAELGGRLETPNFVIHYAKTHEIEAEIALIAADHELRYAQVTSLIGVTASRKIRSFYFADSDQKARLMGARNVEMAKPWRREIYLEHREFPHSSLRHEIAHAVAAEFGDPMFGVAAKTVLGLPVLMSPGLIEGLAVALEEKPNPHDSVRALQELGALPSIDALIGLSFFTVSSSRGYTTAGSFLRFLLDRYGPERLREVYRSGGDFEAAYGMPRRQLEAAWKAMIATIVLPPSTIDSAKEKFRGGSLFGKPCPHAIAARFDRAREALRDGDRATAIALLRDVCDDAPGEPRYRLELAGLLAGADTPWAVAEALRMWIALAADETGVTASLRARAYDPLLRALGAGDLAFARWLLDAARGMALEPDERRTFDGLELALRHTGPAAEELRAYFLPAPDDPASGLDHAKAAAAAEPSLGLAHYLVGIQHSVRREWPETAAALARAIAGGLPGPAFVRNAARRLALAAYRSGDRSRLGVAISALASLGSGDRRLAEDWLERLRHDDTGHTRP